MNLKHLAAQYDELMREAGEGEERAQALANPRFIRELMMLESMYDLHRIATALERLSGKALTPFDHLMQTMER